MTDVQFSMIMGALNRIEQKVDSVSWNNPLVGDNQQRPPAPTEIASNPGKYYGTNYDIFRGDVTSQQVIDLFSPPEDDGDGGVRRKFVGGTLYAWLKADPIGFARYYEQRFKVPLDIDKLHPEQRRLVGL